MPVLPLFLPCLSSERCVVVFSRLNVINTQHITNEQRIKMNKEQRVRDERGALNNGKKEKRTQKMENIVNEYIWAVVSY
jgi:hypothetical protein